MPHDPGSGSGRYPTGGGLRKPYPELDRYTWDQAEILACWPASAFTKLGINPASIRSWARLGQLTPVAIGPNGHVLYHYGQVIARAEAAEAGRSVVARPKP
jgi:hypothetical protein